MPREMFGFAKFLNGHRQFAEQISKRGYQASFENTSKTKHVLTIRNRSGIAIASVTDYDVDYRSWVKTRLQPVIGILEEAQKQYSGGYSTSYENTSP